MTLEKEQNEDKIRRKRLIIWLVFVLVALLIAFFVVGCPSKYAEGGLTGLLELAGLEDAEDEEESFSQRSAAKSQSLLNSLLSLDGTSEDSTSDTGDDGSSDGGGGDDDDDDGDSGDDDDDDGGDVDPAANRIIYSSFETGDWDIYTHNFDTGDKELLIDSSSYDLNPNISPDGTEIVFVSGRDGDAEIYKYNLNTTALTKLTDNGSSDWDPDWHPNGNKIVYKCNFNDGLGDIWTMNSDGSNQTNLTLARSTVEDWDPTYTRDGSKIVFVTRLGGDANTDEMFIMNANGSNVVQITNNTYPDWYPDAHPTENKILFTTKASAASPKGDAIYTMNYSGGNRTKILDEDGDDADQMYSSDGSEIVYTNNNTGFWNLYISDPTGSVIQNITTTNFHELCPIFY